MNSRKPNILILTGELGDGHKQAAIAIEEVVRRSNPQAKVSVVDFMKWTHPYLHSLGKYMFIQSMKHFPSVYGFLYRKTRHPGTFTQMCKKIKFSGLTRLVKLLNDHQPDVVVSTFPFAAKAMSALKTNGTVHMPTVTIITDHTDHSYWLHPFTDQYIVGSDNVKHALVRQGIAKEQIAVTGIPVRPSFSQQFDREALKEKHGLEHGVPTLLVMGGGCGILGDGLLKLLKTDRLPMRMQFLIVCGHNEKLRQQLTDELQDTRHHIRITGFIKHIHELMAVSDLMVTKPGGLTTTEAIASELPMLLYKPLPGQEQDNTQFLLESGVAIEAKNKKELGDKLLLLLQQPLTLAAMKQNAKNLQMKQAAFKAVDIIMKTQNTTVPVWEHHFAEMFGS